MKWNYGPEAKIQGMSRQTPGHSSLLPLLPGIVIGFWNKVHEQARMG